MLPQPFWMLDGREMWLWKDGEHLLRGEAAGGVVDGKGMPDEAWDGKYVGSAKGSSGGGLDFRGWLLPMSTMNNSRFSVCQRPINFSDKFNTDDNHIVLNVENLLKDWPTYVIQFTPQKPGPVKLLLHLRDAKSLDGLMITPKKSSTSAVKPDPDTNTIVSNTPSASELGSLTLLANPVQFLGVLEDPPVKKQKFADEDSVWPPRRSRAYRDVLDLPLAAFRNLMILSAPVKAAVDSPV
ncbi:uncharacterized protein EDB91DRAFT_1297630 [Suillus paluster]|uniref:uncharacterized protein n=1 Tax=Suillus paluster TaxID=48578 RepID=UPI001B8618A0|nr:uncharacterized protein EDB91DRAFT_1297630 [Suillus paluster]KAG1751257.1 hypothetical protein EDB91DRAFT_1297630 [Suillus paluster]